MTKNIREQISTLLDDELSQHEMKQAVDQLSEQEQLRNTWDRYHLIGNVMRGEAGERTAPSLADRVWEQMDAEPAILAAPKPAPAAPAWLRPLAGVAVAASVAVLAVMTAPQLLNPETQSAPAVAAVAPIPAMKVVEPSHVQFVSMPSTQSYHVVSSAQYRAQPVMVARPAVRWATQYSGTRWKNLAKPATESKLNKYLVDHSEYATQGPVRGVVPYATFVGYDARR